MSDIEKEELVVKELCEINYSWWSREKNSIVKILKEICVKYELVKEIEKYWNNEVLEFKVVCK